MSFSLLFPLALLGVGLVAVPVLLHLIDRRRVPRIDFPALRFLMAAQKRLKRRRRIRDPWLLLVRILALLLLVLAYASPVARYKTQMPAGAELSGNVVFLLDNSMSMGYQLDDGTFFELARQRAGEVLDRMAGQGRAGLIVFGSKAEDVTGGVTQDLTAIREAIARVELTHGDTDLRAAVLAGLRALLATPEGGGDLYLLSDQCAHALPADAQLPLPRQLEGNVRLVVSILDDEARSNRSVMGVNAGREGGEGGNVKITATVRGEGEDIKGEVPLDLTLGENPPSRGFVEVASGETVDKVFTLPATTDPSGEGSLRLGNDALPPDNAFFFKLTDRRELKALVIDGDPGDNLANAESFFVERALNPRKSSGSRISPVVIGEGAMTGLDPRETAVVFLLNVSDPSNLVSRLVPYVENGGGLFIALGDRVRKEVYNRALPALLPASIGEIKAASQDLTGEQPPALAYPETGHPIFQIFRESGASVFSTVAFYKLFPTAPVLKPGGKVLLKYTNGLPALLGRTVGAGRVLLFTSSLDRDWSNFPLKSIFLPFIQESAHHLARNPTGEERHMMFSVGQPVVLEVPVPTAPLWVIDPNGKEHALKVPAPDDETSTGSRSVKVIFREADLPGFYHVIERGSAAAGPIPRPELSFVANISAREKDLTLMSTEQLGKRISGIPVVIEGQAQTEGRVQVERTLPFNYGLLWALMAFLGLEGLMIFLKAGRSQRDRPV